MPACLRAVPDFSDDYIHENESKLAVPGYAQTDCYSCRATAGLAVLRTFHPKASFRKFYRNCSPSPFYGTSDRRLIQALCESGVGVSARRNLTYCDVMKAIQSGFPIIVEIGNELFETGDHFVVIYGVGWKPRRVFICNQPRIGNSREELGWNEFRSLWTPRDKASSAGVNASAS